MELGKKIRQLRFKAGLTQEQLADKLGIGPQSVSKWENAVAMPDISALPLLAEVFGVSIDELFDLSTEQRLNRIENRMDAEEELPPDIFREYEDYLKAALSDETYGQRALSLLAYLYWHRMNAAGQKAAHYAKEAIRRAPGVKDCQWILIRTENHACWDWNMGDHTRAIRFYRELVQENPRERLPYLYLIDNLLVDHRADEAEEVLRRLSELKDSNAVMNEIYRAHIALARFQEEEADRIMERLAETKGEDEVFLFEAAQYYARKSDYERAVGYYELAFEKDPRRPRCTDALMGIKAIYEIRGDRAKAAETCDRILDLLENEWHLSEETDSSVTEYKKEKARLTAGM